MTRWCKPLLAALLFLLFSHGAGAATSVYFISPGGLDTHDGRSASRPFKTFARAFSRMLGGDELVLLDGVYSDDAETGTIDPENGDESAQPPSGGVERPTRVHALNPGKVSIRGRLLLGTETRKASHIRLQGMTFSGSSSLYNTSFIDIKEVGFDGPFSIGTNDGTWGNTDNLIEDVWIWAAKERIIAINYRAHRNVWRRVVVRGDGCGTPECSGNGNPNVGFTVYDSHDVSVQNMLVVDRILLRTDFPYGDFAVAQHAKDPAWVFGRNEWLGSISLNAPDIGFYMEPDYTADPTIRLVNCVAWNAAAGGFNLARAGTNNLLENLTANTRSGDGIRVAPELTSGTVRNVIVSGSGRYAINSEYRVTHASISGNWARVPVNQSRPTGLVAGNPRTDGSLKHLTRIEAGSALKGAGQSGADIGANVVYRYGTDGSRSGQPGYNLLSAKPLWPWPNEARIKAEMCAATKRGFCAQGKRLDGVNPISLTSYVWEALGNPVPAGVAQ